MTIQEDSYEPIKNRLSLSKKLADTLRLTSSPDLRHIAIAEKFSRRKSSLASSSLPRTKSNSSTISTRNYLNRRVSSQSIVSNSTLSSSFADSYDELDENNAKLSPKSAGLMMQSKSLEESNAKLNKEKEELAMSTESQIVKMEQQALHLRNMEETVMRLTTRNLYNDDATDDTKEHQIERTLQD